MVPGNLIYEVGVSDDLGTWDYSESQIEQIGLPVPTGDGLTEEVTIIHARLATFDQRIPAAAVADGVEALELILLSATASG